ncbi:MAG TPA: ABC transporter substrate-binding protein [Acidimicrobiia bacterium]|nr:ABC transporter substrate-binding protein [Acidimicrobiia bacterium]
MRKPFVVVVTTLMLAGLAACGSSSKDSEGSTNTTTAASGNTSTSTPAKATPIDCNGTNAYIEDIGDAADFKPVKADTLSVVTSLPGPGFWEGSDEDPSKVTSGYEYDIAKAMQKAFGLKNLEVRNVSFDAIVAGTATDYDVSLSQVTITCERAKVVKFSQPYFFSNQGVLVKSDFDKPIATVEDAKKLKWGVQTATTALTLLEKIGPDSEPRSYTQLTDGYTALEAGQVDAFLIDTAINLGQAARSNGALKVPAQFLQEGGPDQYGAILPKDSTNGPAINAVFDELQKSGELSKLVTKNLTTDPGVLPIIVP